MSCPWQNVWLTFIERTVEGRVYTFHTVMLVRMLCYIKKISMLLLFLSSLNKTLQEKYKQARHMMTVSYNGWRKGSPRIAYGFTIWWRTWSFGAFGFKLQGIKVRSCDPEVWSSEKINICLKLLVGHIFFYEFLPCDGGQHRMSQHIKGHKVPTKLLVS